MNTCVDQQNINTFKYKMRKNDVMGTQRHKERKLSREAPLYRQLHKEHVTLYQSIALKSMEHQEEGVSIQQDSALQLKAKFTPSRPI